MNLKDILLFAVLMFLAGIVAAWISPTVEAFFGAWGLVGEVATYIIVLLPSYWLLNRFWRRRRG